MSTTTVRVGGLQLSRNAVEGVGIAAVLGSVAFGIVMSLTMSNVLFTAIPAMYALGGLGPIQSVLAAWGIHLSHGLVLGLVFGVVALRFDRVGRSVSHGVVVGAVYGLLLWVALASFLMPAWVGAVAPMNPPVPDFRPWSLVGHLLYGAYIGAFIPLYRRY